MSQVVGLQRRKVIETRAEQCEKVTVQKDYGNSNINAIKCLSTGVCRSILHGFIVTQHEASRVCEGEMKTEPSLKYIAEVLFLLHQLNE